MLASLTGTVSAVGLSSAVIDVGGVGFTFTATPATLATLQVERTAQVYVHLVVREDSLTLFGFQDVATRDVFVTLQSVAGVGPKLALAMLAVLKTEDIASAVATSDYATLERVPGIGRKSAQRLVLELAGKLPQVSVAPPIISGKDSPSGQAIAALVNLGWPERTAAAAVATVGGTEVAAILRAALRHLGGHRD